MLLKTTEKSSIHTKMKLQSVSITKISVALSKYRIREAEDRKQQKSKENLWSMPVSVQMTVCCVRYWPGTARGTNALNTSNPQHSEHLAKYQPHENLWHSLRKQQIQPAIVNAMFLSATAKAPVQKGSNLATQFYCYICRSQNQYHGNEDLSNIRKQARETT